MKTAISCGVAKHDADCLCDVVIKEPVETAYGLLEVWHAQIVANAMGYKEGQTGAALAGFLEALASGYDATRQVVAQDEDWLEGTRDAEKREQITALLRSGVSIVDVPDMVHDSFIRVVATMTQAQPCVLWSWSERQWAEWEDALGDGAVSVNQMAKRFSLTYRQADALRKAYGRERGHDARKTALVRAVELYEAHPEWTSTRVWQTLCSEGYEASLQAVRRHRIRWKSAA